MPAFVTQNQPIWIASLAALLLLAIWYLFRRFRGGDRLTDHEIEQMQQHIEHVATILRDIDFELPVLEAIYQMHERLDGKGYPAGLVGDQISRAGQILGACDVFCARLEPRSYRSGIAPDTALEILDQNDTRYDPAIIEALREVVASVAGEKLIAGLAGS